MKPTNTRSGDSPWWESYLITEAECHAADLADIFIEVGRPLILIGIDSDGNRFALKRTPDRSAWTIAREEVAVR